MAQLLMTLTEAEGHFLAVLNLCITHNSGNIACFNYSVKSAPGLWFKLYCQRWRTPQCHWQSHTV